MKVTYTDSGKRELEEFKKRQIQVLERIVSKNKYVLGDDAVEITGSDVRSAANQIRPVPWRKSGESITATLIPIIYVTSGVILALGALAFPYLRDLMVRDRMQFTLFVSGVSLTLVGFLAQLYFRIRKQRLAEYLYTQNQVILGRSLKPHFPNDQTEAGVSAIVRALARGNGEATEQELQGVIQQDYISTMRYIDEGVRQALLRRTQVRGLAGAALTDAGRQYALSSKIFGPDEPQALA